MKADVLVIGGGPAGCWAAVAAAARGATVVLADKGFCGTSGATAPAGTAVWWVAPEPGLRANAKAEREALGGHLASHAWMDRVLAQTWTLLEQLSDWGYPFPRDDAGHEPAGPPQGPYRSASARRHSNERRNSLQGPEYMRLMRKRVKAAGVRILDHHPALELLRDETGRVCGAAGMREPGDDAWTVQAGAVVIATGGCAFRSKALGTDLLTGDGHLMAAEAGATFSGMEFSNSYGLGPAFASVTKSLFYNWATFRHADGTPIPGAGSSRGRSVIARTLIEEPVFAVLDRADADVQRWMRHAQPNFFLPFDRSGIDPFVDAFPITLRLEGTVRGTGGLALAGDDGATGVPGLYAAGDAATRELICGGFTGGGSHNAAWALSSGFWAGAGAADFARHEPLRGSAGRPAGTVALRGGDGAHAADPQALLQAVQDEVFPLQKNWFRHGERLQASQRRLDALWAGLRQAAPAEPALARRTREAASMLAVARWMLASANARTETRGMHRRDDHPNLDPAQQHHVTSGGLDAVWTGTRAAAHPLPALEAAA
jgi:succinate dehydrogenase/fumarate reductase flavoprotein subunit